MTPIAEKKTVLLVDVDEDFLNTTKAALEAAGLNVLTCESLKETEPLLAETWPDLVATEVMLEFPDAGIVLAHRVKKRKPTTPVVLVSAVASRAKMKLEVDTAEDRKWLNADVFMSKPIRTEQLIGAIRRSLHI